MASPPPRKRIKTKKAPAQTDTEDAPTKGDSAADAGTCSAHVAPPSLRFHLTRLKDAPAEHNRYALSLTDILAGNYTRCLLTNYKVDVAWLFGQCPRLKEIPVTLVHGDRDHRAMTDECRVYPRVTPVAPRLPIPFGTHHTKMFVLVFDTRVRVAIFTANFVAGDWDNKTQGVWYQDFELKTLADEEDSDEDTSEQAAPTHSSGDMVVDFHRDLVQYLSTLGAPVAAFCRELARFDFSMADVALIPSVPGYHMGADMEKYGHRRVRRLLEHFQVPPSDHPLICQFSSLGSLNEKWLFSEFARSFMAGHPGIGSDNDDKRDGGSVTPLPARSLHLIWPSVDDVRNSNEGWSAGASIPCPLKNMKPFLHKYLRKWTPPASLHRQNAMPHIKSYARFDPVETTTENASSASASTNPRFLAPGGQGEVDWAILTSANLSKAAWGALQKKGSQLMIRSYELGVLFLPPGMISSLSRRQQADQNGGHQRLCVVGNPAAEVNSARFTPSSTTPPCVLLPLPYSFPLPTYNPAQDTPWIWDLIREDPDVFGNCYLA